MKKEAVKLIVYRDDEPKMGFKSKIKRDISIFAGAVEGFIILGLDETGKINVFVSDSGQPDGNSR